MKYEVEVNNDGTRFWHLNGKRHREDGPAAEYENGGKEWWLNDQPHREDGPAIERSDGSKEWYLNGKFHREDGPAVEYASGYKAWWLNGKRMTKEEFEEATTPTLSQTKVMTIEEATTNTTAVSEPDISRIVKDGVENIIQVIYEHSFDNVFEKELDEPLRDAIDDVVKPIEEFRKATIKALTWCSNRIDFGDSEVLKGWYEICQPIIDKHLKKI